MKATPTARLKAQLRESVERVEAREAGIVRLFVSFLLACAAILFTLAYSYHSHSKIVDGRLASGYLTSRAGIYAAPRVLRVGQSVSRDKLMETLRRAGYVEGEASNVWSGRFVADSTGIEITPRRADQEAQQLPETVRVEFDGRDRVRAITGDGATLASFTLEPEPLTNDAGMKTGRRAALAYGDIPPTLVRAILAIEDRRFFDHSAYISHARAASLERSTRNDACRELDHTQQLVKYILRRAHIPPQVQRSHHDTSSSGGSRRRHSSRSTVMRFIWAAAAASGARRQAARILRKEVKNFAPEAAQSP